MKPNVQPHRSPVAIDSPQLPQQSGDAVKTRIESRDRLLVAGIALMAALIGASVSPIADRIWPKPPSPQFTLTQLEAEFRGRLVASQARIQEMSLEGSRPNDASAALQFGVEAFNTLDGPPLLKTEMLLRMMRDQGYKNANKIDESLRLYHLIQQVCSVSPGVYDVSILDTDGSAPIDEKALRGTGNRSQRFFLWNKLGPLWGLQACEVPSVYKHPWVDRAKSSGTP